MRVTGTIDTARVVAPTSANVAATHGQSFTASSLFTFAVPFRAAATSSPLSLHDALPIYFVLNGSALGANQDNVVSAAQLAQLTYQSGSGADTLWVRASEVGRGHV